MRSYFLRRLAGMVVVVAIVLTIAFVLVRLAPGDPAELMLGPDATPADAAALRARLGLDQPIWEQYLGFMSRAVRGNLGESLYFNRPVLSVLAERAEPTAFLALFSLVIALVIALPLGLLVAYRRGSFLDQSAVSAAMLAASVPSFWTGLMPQRYFATGLGWFPASGYGGPDSGFVERMGYLILPSIVLGIVNSAWGITPARIAKRVAEICGLPLMVHVGEPPPLLDEVFDILTPDDIVTHCFNGKRAGSIADTEALWAQARRLADEGVRMDIGHGAASFDFAVARRAIGDGLKPWSISTDLHLRNIAGPVHDMALTASKLLALGLPLEDCIPAITARPRGVLGLPGAGGLASGTRADFTVFDLADADRDAADSQGNHLRLPRLLEPRMTVIGASVAAAARRAG